MALRKGTWVGLWMTATVAGAACGGLGGSDDDCLVGSQDCRCTDGGACDPGLECLSGVCTSIGGTTDDGATPADTAATPTGGGATMGATGGDTTDGMPPLTTGLDSSGEPPTGTTDDGGGPILDVGPPPTGGIGMGCQAIDVLFAVDGSASMIEERAALAATGAFTQVIMALEALNGGGIDYRIAVTDDDDHGFMVPPGWFEPDPWFDSTSMTPMEIANAFNGAVGQVGGIGGAALGCEHVLTSASTLLSSGINDFVRDDALLVLVLLTDVDDYGAYDQMGGNVCGIGCATPPPNLGDLVDELVTVKNGDIDGVSAIVVAGDPNVAAGVNICQQPGSCGCAGFDCEIFHATRLYEFTDMLGANGYSADLCSGPASVPMAVETALNVSIDIACQNFEPEG
ncbi:MAG: hypothetical protein AAF799_04710 [Myxococcota bacterium]